MGENKKKQAEQLGGVTLLQNRPSGKPRKNNVKTF
jgi:hypothetical protein